MNQEDWRQDPRLAHLNPQKLAYITDLAERISHLPKDQVLPTFLAMQADANKNGIRFSDTETELLVSVLSTNMSPAEKKKLEMFRVLAQKLAVRSS